MIIKYIAIGSELLKGRIINTNLTNAGELLRAVGLDIHKGLEIKDDRETILKTLEYEMQDADFLIFSGGLGPTSDDITKKTLADFFGMEMAFHQPSIDFLEKFFEDRGRTLSERNKLQALLPVGCTVLTNEKGTAPAMYFPCDNFANLPIKGVFSLPGVPNEMLHLIEHKVIPIIQQAIGKQYIKNHIFRLWGIPEADLADKLVEVEATFPAHLDISYLPRLDGIWLEITVRGEETDKETLDATLTTFAAKIREIVQPYLYAESKDELERLVNSYFRNKKLKLAIAESITGGGIAARLVQISGASEYLKGSMVTYMVETKTEVLGISADLIAEKGVASAEVAQAMAKAVKEKLNADIGLATTGYAQPPAPQELPYVWIGFSDNEQVDSRKEFFFFDRKINITRTINAALIFLYRKMCETL